MNYPTVDTERGPLTFVGLELLGPLTRKGTDKVYLVQYEGKRKAVYWGFHCKDGRVILYYPDFKRFLTEFMVPLEARA